MKRLTITFQPTADVASFISKEINKICGKKSGDRARRGVKTRLINEALHRAYGRNRGKREVGA